MNLGSPDALPGAPRSHWPWYWCVPLLRKITGDPGFLSLQSLVHSPAPARAGSLKVEWSGLKGPVFLIHTWDGQGCSRAFPRRATRNPSKASHKLLIFHWFRWCRISTPHPNRGNGDWLNLIDLNYSRGTRAIKSESELTFKIIFRSIVWCLD